VTMTAPGSETYVMVKPDGVQRGLVGRILQRFEDKGFRLLGLKLRLPTDELLRKHYAALANRPFFSDLMAYLSSGPVVCMCLGLSGEEAAKSAVPLARALIGPTDPTRASVGTIRGDYGLAPSRNVVHGADSSEAARSEIALWFANDEIIERKVAFGVFGRTNASVPLYDYETALIPRTSG
jgi:nucleoside-diphosphate kinase